MATPLAIAGASRTVVVGCPDAAGVFDFPQFKVLWSVVAAISVAVMNALVWFQVASEGLLHDVAVLHERLSSRSVRVTGDVDGDVPVRLLVARERFTDRFLACSVLARVADNVSDWVSLVPACRRSRVLGQIRLLSAAALAQTRRILPLAGRRDGSLPVVGVPIVVPGQDEGLLVAMPVLRRDQPATSTLAQIHGGHGVSDRLSVGPLVVQGAKVSNEIGTGAVNRCAHRISSHDRIVLLNERLWF